LEWRIYLDAKGIKSLQRVYEISGADLRYFIKKQIREIMNIILRIIGIVGVLLFASGFIFTYSMPGFVEKIGQDFIKDKVSEKTNKKIATLNLKYSNNALVKLAGKFAKKNEAKISALKEKLKSKAYIKLAAVIAEMRDLDCECRKKYENYYKNELESNILSLKNANVLLMDFMKSKYMEVSKKLKKDIRIFTGSNTIVFLFLVLLSFLKPQAITHLFLPGILLVVSTVVCSYFYIFEQNWFFTIIYSTYLGWGYLIYLGIVFLFLCDIALNKARVTTEIINSILSAIGSVGSVGPC